MMRAVARRITTFSCYKAGHAIILAMLAERLVRLKEIE